MTGPANRHGHSMTPVRTPCGECGSDAECVGGDRVYPHRPDLSGKRFYLCPACGAYVGTHPGTCQPLGSPANATTRAARSRAHAHFDPLWREVGRRHPEGGSPRKRGYRWLAGKMGMTAEQCHIGMMTAHEAELVVEICRPELDRLSISPERR